MRMTTTLFALLLLAGCMNPCGEEPPKTTWDLPLCTDTELDTCLLDNATHGDPSALQLLQKRFETAFTVGERHHIAALLLRVAPDDRPYWNELSAHAENAVRFFADETQLTAYCGEHECEPERYMGVAERALQAISDDARSRPLLRRVLETDDVMHAQTAIDGLAHQHDESALSDIDAFLERHAEGSESWANALSGYGTEAADQIALKHLSKEAADGYREARKACR